MDYLFRELEETILNLWNAKRFFLIRGPRRAGKTTLLKHLQEVQGGTYVSFESPSAKEEFLKHPLLFVKNLPEPIFLDEIQYTGEKGARALKWIYDATDKKVLISGSGAFDVRMKLLAYLVGRTYLFDLLPLSFSEFVKWKKPEIFHIYEEGNRAFLRILYGQEAKLPGESPILEALFDLYGVLGGYPEVVLSERKEEIESIVTTTIEEDVIRYFSLRAHGKMWDFVKKLASLTGQILSLSSLNLSFQTAEEYLAILERSFVVRRLSTYSTNRLVELTKAKKVYFYDVGFRNALLGRFRWEGAGPLMENIVFRQLLKYGEVLYWRSRSKAEVDFVVLQEGSPVPIEVKTGRGKMTRSLRSFLQRYKPPTAVVVSSEVWEKRIGETMVYGLPGYYL